jgi:membrane dipeptidase
MPNLIFDAHLDLSMNAMEWNRDFTQPLPAIRNREKGMTDKPDRGKGTISFEEMRKGHVGICAATMIAHYVSTNNPLPGWHSPEQAWAQTQGQLAWYRTMEDKGEMAQISNKDELQKHLTLWENAEATDHLPIGYILSLEGADSIIDMSYLEKAYQNGLRALGPAHYGPGVYAYGTDSAGSMGQKGQELLKKMEELNIILDVTHLCDESFWEALDHFNGPMWASHNNCRALVPNNRQFSDKQIKTLIERDAVIGAAFDAWMLMPGWERGKTTPQETGVSLKNVVDHIDHVCQLAGNTLHSAIGTDLDGGFGREQCPTDLETIADLQKIPTLLKQRGYTAEDIENIMYKNWVKFLIKSWE